MRFLVHPNESKPVAAVIVEIDLTKVADPEDPVSYAREAWLKLVTSQSLPNTVFVVMPDGSEHEINLDSVRLF